MDPALGRWIQPDSIVPVQSQGVQAWDRFAYVNNNPVRYTDPTGQDVGCSAANPGCLASNGLTPEAKAEMAEARRQYSVETNSIALKGGPGGVTSYKSAAEASYTDFHGSGATSKPSIAGPIGVPGLANDLLVLARDNTGIRELIGTEISGKVNYQAEDSGFRLTGVTITNSSYENVRITSVYASTHSLYGDNRMSSGILYPYRNTSLLPSGYGVAEPGSTSQVKINSGVIYNWNYVNISITVRSESGRYGNLGINLSVNPPEPK